MIHRYFNEITESSQGRRCASVRRESRIRFEDGEGIKFQISNDHDDDLSEGEQAWPASGWPEIFLEAIVDGKDKISLPLVTNEVDGHQNESKDDQGEEPENDDRFLHLLVEIGDFVPQRFDRATAIESRPGLASLDRRGSAPWGRNGRVPEKFREIHVSRS